MALGEEPFTLSDVYVETECGILKWQEIQEGKLLDTDQQPEIMPDGRSKFDPFDLRVGGRNEMLGAVMELIGDKSFKDAIVIQGPAGSGKSAFTLRLCVELLSRGLKPIRIRFRDLPLHNVSNILDALPEAVRFWEPEDRPNELPQAKPEELFANQTLFDQRVDFNGCTICPWVLIIDGWDEVSIGVEKGFAVRVNEILGQIRDKFINRGNHPLVRVVLTGRPSEAVSSSSFMTKETRLLTIRPLDPDKLTEFVCRLAHYFSDPSDSLEAHPDRFQLVLQDYKDAYVRLLEKNREIITKQGDAMEVLGLPLLAHLAVRLMVRWPESDLQALVNNPTTLYRHLTDLTCLKGGRYGKDVFEPSLPSTELRRLLHETAAAMTVFGRDHIPYDELDIRLSALDEQLLKRVQEATKDHPLTSLMIGFFFKGGHKELGAEFLHKSFREYLFAECIVEALKAYGRVAPEDMAERDVFWKDFDPYDKRFDLSRRLSRLLAPQWITSEVAGHLHELIKWESARAHGQQDEIKVGQPTELLDLKGWKTVRDGLADLWDWWGEGVHLRQQPKYQGKKLRGWENPYVTELLEWAMPLDPDKDQTQFPPRPTTMDAHLGDGLCRLAALVHHYVAVPPGIEPKWEDLEVQNSVEHKTRRYQSMGYIGNTLQVRFKPSGVDTGYFMNYVARINSGGWRPQFYFPMALFLNSVDFSRVDASICSFGNGSLMGAKFSHAHLFSVLFWGADLRYSDFTNAVVQWATFDHVNLSGSKLDNIMGADEDSFKNANLENTCLYETHGKNKQE